MPPNDEKICPICKWGMNSAPLPHNEIIKFDCPRCGRFSFTASVQAELPAKLKTPKQRAALSHAIRRAQRDDELPLFDTYRINPILEQAYVPGAYEQADNLIRWLGDTADGPGIIEKLNVRDHGAIAGALLDAQSFRFLTGEMLKSGLLEGDLTTWSYKGLEGGTKSVNGGAAHVTLSFRGWKRYDELRRGSDVWLYVRLAKVPSERLAPSLRFTMVHARSIVASRIGAAGYKLMRSSHETWTPSQDPLKARRTKNRDRDATLTKTALTASGSYKRTSQLIEHWMRSVASAQWRLRSSVR